MKRDMSYELDGMFAGRNAGELVSVKQTRTKITRSPGLAPAARMAGGDVKNLTPMIAHKLSHAHNKNIVRPGFHSLGIPMAKSLSLPIFHQPSDLADDGYDYDYDMPFSGMDGIPATVTLPIVGQVNTYVAVAGGLALAFAAYKLLK